MSHGLPSLGQAVVAGDATHLLAEGPVWDPVRRELLWVDILRGEVFSGRLSPDGAIDGAVRARLSGPATAVAVSADGDLLVAGRDRLHITRADGMRESRPVPVGGPGRRLNDGKPDPAGYFVVGTMTEPTSAGDETLFRVEGDGTVTIFDDDLGLSNGLAWSSDGTRLYSVDTLSKRIFVRDYDATAGTAGPRTILASLDDTFPDAFPDGMTIDSEGCLWVAMWGGGCVVRLSPSGRPLAAVDVPAPRVSCPVFAGEKLDTLVITTASTAMSAEKLAEFPLSGRLFTTTVGVTGTPSHLWNGLTADCPDSLPSRRADGAGR